MPAQRIPDEAPRHRFSDEQIDKVVLGSMLGKEPWPWSMDEIARELGDQADAIDAVGRLTACGLVHRIGEFVFPTRTARRAAEIEIGTL